MTNLERVRRLHNRRESDKAPRLQPPRDRFDLGRRGTRVIADKEPQRRRIRRPKCVTAKGMKL